MDNAGQLKRVGNQYQAWFGKVYPEDEVLLAAHRHGGPVAPWHAYTEAQIERAMALAELLVEHYGLEDILGHEDIAAGRKIDPGPAFPLSGGEEPRPRARERFAAALPGDGEQPEHPPGAGHALRNGHHAARERHRTVSPRSP
jgi:hypothetical protein